MTVQFSIVITTYNSLESLKQAIESALSQTVPCEVVLVDDGSNDGTPAYARSLGKRVVYYRHRVHLGYAESVNVGVELAQGNWIGLLDDRDRLMTNCLEQKQNAIARYPQAAIVSCQTIQVDAKDSEISCTHPVGSTDLFHVPQDDIHYQMLFDLLPLGMPAQVTVRRDAFLRSGRWKTLASRSCEALDFWVRVAQYGDAVFVNQPLSYCFLQQQEADGKQLSIQEFEQELTIKQTIYQLLPTQYRAQLSESPELQNFLKLYRSLASSHKGGFPEAEVAWQPSVPVWKAWHRLARNVGEGGNELPTPNQRLGIGF